MARKRIGEILIAAGILDEAGLKRALIEQRRWGGHLGEILIDLKLVREEELVAALSRQLKFPTAYLDDMDVPREVLSLVSGELAEQSNLVPFNVEGKFLDVAMSDPTNLGIIDELRIRTQLNVRTYLAGPKAIDRALQRFYGRGKGGVGLQFSGGGAVSSEGFLAFKDVSDTRLEVTHGLETPDPHTAEIRSLQDRISSLEALVRRDEDVIRKLLGLLVDKGIASRDEILERIR